MFADRVSRIEEVRGVIVHLDEGLTMSARMAATTGDLQWEERYRRFEPQLAVAIKETTKIGAGSPDIKAVTRTDAANIKLQKMENRAFALVRDGHKEEAQAELFSPEYEAQKQIYAEGIKSFTSQTRREFGESLRHDQRIDLLSIIAALVVGGTSFVAWFSAARGVRRWRAQLLDSFHRRAEAEENLRKAHAELARREGEARYRLLVDHSPDAIFVICDEKILFVNPAAVELLGASGPEQLTGRTASEIMYPDDRAAISVRMSEVREGKQLPIAAGRLLRLDGSTIEVESRVIAFLYEGKQALQMTVRDITDRKAAEKQLREADEKYRSIVDNALEGIFQSTPDGVFLSANPAFARMLGFASAQEMMHERKDINRQSYADPATRQEFKRLLEQDGAVNDFEFEVKRKDGSRIWVSENARIVRDAAGNTLYYEGSALDITERKQAGDRMRAILESALDCVITMDHHGRIVEFNPAAEKTFGYKRDCAIGQSLADLIIPPALRERHQRGLAHYLSTGQGPTLGRRIELTGMRSDHSEFPLELAITRIGSQEPPIFTGFIRDITERRENEEALRRQQTELRVLFDLMPAMIWFKDTENGILRVNKRAAEAAGKSIEEIEGKPSRETYPREAARFYADDLEVIHSGVPKLGIVEMMHGPEGKELWVQTDKVPYCNEDGKPVGIVVMAQDVTKRKQAEEKLAEQAELLNLAQDAIMVRGMDDRIEFWNRGAELLYGWSAEEVRGQPSGEFLDYEKPVKILADRTLLETGAWSGECHHLTKQGDTVIVCSRWTLVRDEHGQPKAKLIIATDVTEQRNLEAHLLRAQRLESIGTLASGMAHDLNNILTPILICAETLRGDMTTEDRETVLALIEESAERGASVIKQVLTFARGIEGERVSINPSHLVHEMVDIARKTFPKSIEITSRYPADLWPIKGDPTQLHQVLLNISVNARDAMPAGGKLALVSENFAVDEQYAAMTPGAMPGSYVLLQISDTGGGMSQETIDRIFDPFFTTKELGHGTGLGLSTTVGIVKSHGGFISVHSEVGNGTIFKIFLPADLSAQSPLSSKPRIAPAEGNGELVLVVDDEANILRATKTILEKHNYRVVSASGGAEAVALFAQQMRAIKVVLTDISMPQMDGVAAVRALRKMKPDVSIIASTGEAQQARLEELRAMNVTNFLIKPFSTANLLAAVHASIGACDGVEGEVQVIT